ncbi:hypothetical protein F0562_027640 [Nyssa sinensis]|uniref:UBC core domain-containing protein n=1 Tax=Nyssa sinensis TaxID=561372 RepID=A0A5J5B5A0_9ASTE|nr:hypothetical protein F0562_027640 [Nyssa sinensis]
MLVTQQRVVSGSSARGRLAEERKAWRKNHPHGFVAKPETSPDGFVHLKVWHCTIPGKPGLTEKVASTHLHSTSVRIIPANPPNASSLKVSSTLMSTLLGTVCLSILSEDSGWRPAITMKQMLVGIQDLLDQPNPADPAQTDGYQLSMQEPAEYKRRVRQQAKQYPPLI